MQPHPYRNNLDGIDLRRPADCRKILLLDKHTRIEGLCSEAVFMEDIVEGNLSPVTEDFWFTRSGRTAKYEIIKVVTSYDKPLSELDYLILDKLATAEGILKTGIVHFDESTNTFRVFRHLEGQRYDQLREMGNVWPLSGKGMIAEDADRNEERTIKACDFLAERGLLKEAAIKRIFANCILDRAALWDVDAFTLAGQTVVALEVKHKYPTNNEKFGVNVGQEDLFGFLIGTEMAVIHIILEKPVHRPAFPAIDLLTKEEYIEKAVWRFIRLVPENLSGAVSRAPASTSIYGHMELSYRGIPVEKFAVLKGLREKGVDVRGRLLRGLHKE